MSSGAFVVVTSTVINTRDCGALVTFAAAFCITLSLLSYGARLRTRWPWRTLFGYDDLITSVATVLTVVQSVMAIRAVDAGLGVVPEDLSDSAISRTKKLLHLAETLFVVAVYTSKIAVSVLLHRLTSKRNQRTYATAITAACIACGGASILAVTIKSGMTGSWPLTSDSAHSTRARWIAYATMSCLLDILISVAPFSIVRDVQMPFSKKANVVVCFALRLILLPVSILRLISLDRALRSDAVLYDYTTVEIYTEAEMCLNVLCATIPSLPMFLKSVQTGLLDLGPWSSRNGTLNSGSRLQSSQQREIINKRQSARIRAKERDRDDEEIELTQREEGKAFTVVTSGRNQDDDSINSDSSERAIVVKKTVRLQYDM